MTLCPLVGIGSRIKINVIGPCVLTWKYVLVTLLKEQSDYNKRKSCFCVWVLVCVCICENNTLPVFSLRFRIIYKLVFFLTIHLTFLMGVISISMSNLNNNLFPLEEKITVAFSDTHIAWEMQKHLTPVLVFCCCDQIPENNKLKGERFALALSFRGSAHGQLALQVEEETCSPNGNQEADRDRKNQRGGKD